jgi:uncharacterized membrane protein YesL
MLLITAAYSLVFYMTTVSISMVEYVDALGAEPRWMFTVAKIMSYSVILIYSIMTMHMITMSTTYELKFRHLLKNSFLFTVGLIPHNVFFLACGFLPF